MANNNDTNWIDKKIYYTYHSKKNEDAFLKVLFFSILFIFLNNAWIYELFLWGWYLYYCSINNYKLNHDEQNLKDRQWYTQYKSDISHGKR